ncbi:succinate dehydrogenase subunit 4, mitochondrial-like [Salvia hispanica]|uniref:succinate dehydrogenase subunit 4, mitochondrial-like n=1 Tax=Salvia hispanica TaxID=49212 RepID=UPI002009541C|nr:succinate dehydrogenase subunit 4, mitochondrial-like [Salvia hispanica]XP_047951337.1 succinate dehydrogenase subunit 4, mitochondrial-like [Salvia hispanica]
MANSRSASAAIRLSRSAASAFRGSSAGRQIPHTPSAAGQSAIGRPRALMFPTGGNISSSASCLNRVASRPYSSSAQIPGTRAIRSVLWHINDGMEEVLADYVHHEMTRTWISICLRLFVIIMTKDVVVAVADL